MTTREERMEKYKKGILQCFPFGDPSREFLADRAAFWRDSAAFWRDEYCKLKEAQEDE